MAGIKEKADAAESKIESATGIKGSSGNWFSSHPALLVVGAVLLFGLFMLRACVV